MLKGYEEIRPGVYKSTTSMGKVDAERIRKIIERESPSPESNSSSHSESGSGHTANHNESP